MRKHIVLAAAMAALTLAAQALTGISYRGEVKVDNPNAKADKKEMSAEDKQAMRSMGLDPDGNMGFEFEAMADNGRFKMVYLTGFAMFPKGSYMLGDSAAKIVYFVYPDRKEYVEMNVDEMGQAAQQMAKSMKITYANQTVDVSPLPPKVVSGQPCTGKRITLAYDTQTSFMGMKQKTRTEETTDYYTTAAYDVLALFGDRNWHTQGLTTGDAAFDKVVAAKVGFLGFPMQVITHRVVNGKDEGTTTLTTHDVQMKAFLPGTFDLPAGYAKTEFGFGSLMKNMMQSKDQGGGESAQSDSSASGDDPSGQQAQPEKKKKPSLRDLLKGLGK
jgi:hypothetical protein